MLRSINSRISFLQPVQVAASFVLVLTAISTNGLGKARPAPGLRVQIADVHWQSQMGSVSGYGHGNVFEGTSGRGFDYAFSCESGFLATNGDGFYPAYWRKYDQRLVIQEGDFNNPSKRHYCELKVMTRNYLYAPNNTPLKTVPLSPGVAQAIRSSRNTTIGNLQDPTIAQEERRQASCKSTYGQPLSKELVESYKHDYNGEAYSPVIQSSGSSKQVQNPMLISKVEPSYSPDGCIQKIQGTVLLSIVIDKSGHARNIVVQQGIGYGLDEKAVEAVRAWKFRPAIERVVLANGALEESPLAYSARVEVNFKLL